MKPPSVATFGRALRTVVLVLGIAIGLSASISAQEEALDDVLGGIGTTAVDDSDAPGDDEGTISGQVIDGQSGLPLSDVTVIVIWPRGADGGEPRQDVVVTDIGGFYEFGALPAGTYELSFIKSGYRASTMQGFEVVAGVDNTADFPMPPSATDAVTGEVLDLEAFVVEASTVGEIMSTLELRLESDQLLNVLSAEDLSKFASSDVADALKRVAGVNIVEGQFAIIRGLEERYSSTLFNGAPVPSPDPDRQSVQLDLFPSDIVSNIEIAKSFAAESPSNSSGGSVDIATSGYPELWTAKVSVGSGYNDRAWDEFLEYQPHGGDGGFPTPIPKVTDERDVIERDISLLAGGTEEIFGREVRIVASYSEELDFSTREGTQQDFEPGFQITVPRLARPGDLALGALSLPGALWDLTQSSRVERESTYFGAGFDFDTEGNHRIDLSIFLTETTDENAERRENGRFPPNIYDNFFSRSGVDSFGSAEFEFRVAPTEWVGQPRLDASTTVRFGQLWYAPVWENRIFDRERELDLYQLNGEHDLGSLLLDGLKLSWVANMATTEQSESQFNVRYFFEPQDAESISTIPANVPIPVPVEFLSPGLFTTRNDIVFGINEIEEEQIFARADLEYEFAPLDILDVKLNGGVWYEFAEREVESQFRTVFSGVGGRPGVNGFGTSFNIQGRTIEEMGARIFRGIGLDRGLDPTLSEGEREIMAGHVSGKFTLYEDLDVLAGLRLEQLRIETKNDPFLGTCSNGDPFDGGFCPGNARALIFPDVYVLFDRLDNPNIVQERAFAGSDVLNNDEIVGIDVSADPASGFIDYRDGPRIRSVVNNEIDELYTLPSFGITYRFESLSQQWDWAGFLEPLTFRGSFSQTVARPSFREIGYYASLRSGDDTILLGNPQLDPSEVTSYDVRFEYLYGDFGDLLALSGFIKQIEDPIETVTVRDPFGQGIDTYLTYRNNPDDPNLFGAEVEGRFTFGLLHEWLEPLSMGGNATYILAEVENDPRLRDALQPFFALTPEQEAAGLRRFSRYERKRRLTNQPEWIVNADVSFDNPDWRTKITLSFFAISDVLDATAATDFSLRGELISFALDRYTDQFHQFDLVASQGFTIPYIPGVWTIKGSVKNLTDTDRGIIYDREQTIGTVDERRFKVGRDYSLALSYQLEFGGDE